MTPEQSVSFWIDQLKAGDAAAVRPLWERYFVRLVGLARKKLQGSSRAVADEEDVALSAFNSFCRAVDQGRFPKLDDRDDLWRVLVTVTERKAINLVRDQRRLKRGGGLVRNEPPEIPGDDPSPEFAAIVAEECQRLLHLLDDEALRAMAVSKMEGYTNEEIADRHGLALRSVERKLGLIRKIWQDEQPDPS